jgi:diadenosine tetraphosphate (Ap4A) HIT family hydrolase
MKEVQMESQGSCIICGIVEKTLEGSIVYSDSNFIVFLDKRPLLYGHCLLAPKLHKKYRNKSIFLSAQG